MIKKEQEKTKAIRLRKSGKTYSEILAQVSVAKSTLTLWLHDVGLAEHQKQRLTEKKLLAAQRGGLAKRKQRMDRQLSILSKAKSEIGLVTKRELFLIGAVLYWAEGSKEKDYHPGSRVAFSNMDPKMIRIFIRWLVDIAKIPKDMIGFQIFLHDSHKNRLPEVVRYWQKVTGFSRESFQKVYFKRNLLSATKRRNVQEAYNGVLRVIVKQSSSLVRKIAGWTEGIVEGVEK